MHEYGKIAVKISSYFDSLAHQFLSDEESLFRHETGVISFVYLIVLNCKSLLSPFNTNLRSGVCLGGKLSPFSDISQNLTLEERTLHKIRHEKNRLFAKFNIRKTDSSQNST